MTFTVTTTEGEHRFIIATDYKFAQVRDNDVLQVIGDDDWKDGPQTLRTFNLDYVVDYGWEKFSGE